MKAFLVGFGLAVAYGAALAGHAGASGRVVIQPVRFAVEYCQLRRLGVPDREAIHRAVRLAGRSGEDPGSVRAWGRDVGADTYLAVQAVEEGCPEFLGR